MAQDVETNMADALDAAAAEAVAEFDEAQSEEGIEVADEDIADESDEEALEAADDESDDDEVPDTEDEEPADEAEDEEADFSWDGNPETVPEELKPYFDHIYGTMRKGWDKWSSKKANEWNLKRQEYESRIAELELARQKAERAASAPPRPVRPGEGATAEDWEKYDEALIDYRIYQQELKRSPDPAPEQVQQQRQAELLRRGQYIEAMPGYNEEIGNKMVELAESDPDWSTLFQQSDQGAAKLFQFAKTQVEAEAYKKAAAKAEQDSVRNKAKAAKRAVRKPSAPSKKTAPVRDYASMTFEEKLEASTKDAFAELGL